MEVARPVKEERHREISLMLPIKLGYQARRYGKAQARPRCARVNHGKSQRLIRPRVISVQLFEMFHPRNKFSLPLHDYQLFAMQSLRSDQAYARSCRIGREAKVILWKRLKSKN